MVKEFTEKASSESVGDVVITGAGKLGYAKIFHVVLPQWENDNADFWKRLLVSAILSCLEEASKADYQSIVFPPFGVGRLKCPEDVAAETMVKTINLYLRNNSSTSLQQIFICDRFGDSAKYFQKAFYTGDVIYVRKQGTVK